jgi:ATP-dependent Lon protease
LSVRNDAKKISKELMSKMSVEELRDYMKKDIKEIMDNYFRSDNVKESYIELTTIIFTIYKEKLETYS